MRGKEPKTFEVERVEIECLNPDCAFPPRWVRKRPGEDPTKRQCPECGRAGMAVREAPPATVSE